jgi:glycosyltransferase involved in cell wall biosynthesis
MKLVVTIPAHNEDPTIGRVVRGVPRDIDGIDEVEVIVVNDGSTDRTFEEAEAAGATVVSVTGRPGLGSIFRIGMDRAMRAGADLICNIDGDGQFEPADIRRLVAPLLDDEADFVTCSRFANPSVYPDMPPIKFHGNRWVTQIINFVCGGTKYTDVSCGFRAFNREAAYRMTLFGKYTYTHECFVDLYSKGCRIVEVPIKIRGVREHGESRIAKSLWKYGTNSLETIVRAGRDIQPLKFFGSFALLLFTPGVLLALFVSIYYLVQGRTTPWTSLIGVSGTLLTLGVILGALALLADMIGRHRRITEELLYLTRKRLYANARTMKAAHLDDALGPVSLHTAAHGEPTIANGTLEPVMREIADSMTDELTDRAVAKFEENRRARRRQPVPQD